MAISGVGGTPQGDPLQAQRIEVRQKWDQLNMDLTKLSNALKKLRDNMTVTKSTGRYAQLRPGVDGDVRDLINQIKGIQGQLKSMNDSGQLTLLAGNKTKGNELFNELWNKLDAVQQKLVGSLWQPSPNSKDAERYSQYPEMIVGIKNAVRKMRKIVQ